METNRESSKSMLSQHTSSWPHRARAMWFVQGQFRTARTLEKITHARNHYRKALNYYNLVECRTALTSFNMSHLETLLRDMGEKRTRGPDELEIAFVKHRSTTGRQRLLHLINRSYAECMILIKWRLAMLVPIPNPGAHGRF